MPGRVGEVLPEPSESDCSRSVGFRHLRAGEPNTAPAVVWIIIAGYMTMLGFRRTSGLISGPTRVWPATAVLLLFFFLAIDSLIADSPTMDEQNHIARGLAFLRTGDPRLSLEHPPLVNSLSALLLLTMPELRLPTDHPSWERREGWYEFADLFMWQYNHDATRVTFLARLPVVFLSLGLALAGYHFARELWGAAAALPALAFLLFEPNLMAHGRYATTDMGATLFSFLATFALWRLWRHSGYWNRSRWMVAALALGLAFGSKLSTLGFLPVWLLLALLPLYPMTGKRGRAVLRRVAQLVSAAAAALVIVWLIFGLEWGLFSFVTDGLAPLNRWAGPMPTFWAGLEQAALLGSGGRAPAFLFGRFAPGEFPLYFPVAFVVKTPLILLALIVFAAVFLLLNRKTRRRALFLLVTSVGYYTLAAQSALNIGYRHVLPALPYLLVLAAGLASPALRRKTGTPRVFPAGLVYGSAAALVAVALWIHPHYLSYFNPAVGGPANGYRVLTDSNVDWGQDLLRLRVWMGEHEVERLKLGWFGSADPNYYHIAHDPLPGLGRDAYFRLWWEPPFDPAQPQPGIYAISASSLWEPPLRVEEKQIYAWFRARQPDDRVGYSILIYDVR